MLRRLLSNLPVVGLLANILTPGGVAKRPETLAFQEYVRIMGDRAPGEFSRAIGELPAENKTLLLIMWIACTGPKAKTMDSFCRSANRLRLSGSDVEMELTSFEEDRESVSDDWTREDALQLADAMVRVLLTENRYEPLSDENERLLAQALQTFDFPIQTDVESEEVS